MTTEERLMNEAEDYAREKTPIESHVPYLCARSRIKQAYLACAKLREKQIAELIQENEEIKKGLGCETCQIHLEFTKLNQKITDLEALIKSEHEIEARKNNNLISQLDKAKEMLRWFLIYEKGVGIITNFNNFLNEVAEFINYTE